MHGVLQIIEKALGWQKYEGKNWAVRFMRIGVTFLLVNFAWVFFRMPSVGDAFGMIGHMFTFGIPNLHIIGFTNLSFLLIAMPILFIKDVSDEYWPVLSLKANKNIIIRWSVYLLIGFLTVISYTVAQDFIYFQF